MELVLLGECTGVGDSDGPRSWMPVVAVGVADRTMGPSACAGVVEGLSVAEAVDDGVEAIERLAVAVTVAVS